jgi:hypothetical protein
MIARRLLAAAAALLCAACFETRVADPGKEGNSSETVARVGGTLVDAEGMAVEDAWVALVPEDYNPVAAPALPSGLIASSGGGGAFAFSRVPKGRYSFEARHPGNGTRLIKQGVDLRDTEEALGENALAQPGKVRMGLPENIEGPGGYVYIPHTRLAWPVDAAALDRGYLELDSLPASEYEAIVFSRTADLAAPDTLARKVAVAPGDSLSLGAYAGWGYSARIALNTTASGAALASPVADFPLLVRLTRSELDFSQAAADGSDLRFSRPDGSPAPYQIDHGDAAAGVASVWVLVDTVRPNDSGESIRMHWGKPGAAAQSDGPAVFGQAGAGYAAAWHLEEEAAGTGTPGVYRNAAATANHGLDSLSTTDRAGVIGNGHFLARGDYIRVPAATADLKPTGGFAFSAWIKAVPSDTGEGEILSMGNDYGMRLFPDGQLHVFNYNLPKGDSTTFRYTTSGQNLHDGRWHLVAAVFDGTHIDTYVDGAFAGGSDFPRGARRYDGGPDFYIGRHGNREAGFDFTGYLDEVRVLPALPTAAWMKLAFASQRQGASILSFAR